MILDMEKKSLLENANKIIAFSPHPDDTEIIAGGYLSKMRSKGSVVKLIVLTDGRKGTKKLSEEEIKEIRHKEQIKASKILDVELEFLNFQDLNLPDPENLRDIILPKIRSFGPDIVVTVDPFLKYEVHPDHIKTGLGVLQAVLFYPLVNVGGGIVKNNDPVVALGATDEPNVIINIDDFMDKKIKAIKAHESQDLNIKSIEYLSSKFGKIAGFKYGEPFRVLYRRELHMNISDE